MSCNSCKAFIFICRHISYSIWLTCSLWKSATHNLVVVMGQLCCFTAYQQQAKFLPWHELPKERIHKLITNALVHDGLHEIKFFPLIWFEELLRNMIPAVTRLKKDFQWAILMFDSGKIFASSTSESFSVLQQIYNYYHFHQPFYTEDKPGGSWQPFVMSNVTFYTHT